MTSPAALRSARLAAQRIGARAGRTATDRAAAPAEVARHMFALQGQDLAQTLWAVGVRSTGVTRADVVAAFDRGDLVRSWPMRGTLHTLTADDLRLLLSLTAERTVRATATRFRELGIDDAVLDRARDVVVRVLGGGASAPREDILDGFRAAGIDPADGRGYNLLLRLAQDGLVAWGPTARVGQALVLLDDWSPARRAVPERDDALTTAFVRWLRGRLPATLADFAGWTKLPLGDARRALAGAGDAVVQVDHDRYATAERAETGGIASAHLLPGCDEYLLGYVDRSAVLDHGTGAVASSNGIFWPVAVVRGRVVGRWSRPPSSGTLTLTPFEPIGGPDRRALLAAADRYATFLGASLDVRFDDGHA